MIHRRLWLLLVLAGAQLVAGEAAATDATSAIQASHEIAADELLDVGVQVLDPGVTGVDPTKLEEMGIYPDLRRAEAIYIAVRLTETLQTTGNWGAVRVVPKGVDTIDLTVSGRIVESTGKDLEVSIRAWDTSGRTWLAERYREEADPLAYGGEDKSAIQPAPFRALYSRIANDLLRAHGELDSNQLRSVRQISQLRFAADLASDRFEGYLTLDEKRRYTVARVPSKDDPMMARIAAIRERDEMFVDTLDEHYASFRTQMEEPYDNWRSFSYEEQVAKEKLQRKGKKMKILGAVGVLGGLLTHGGGNAGRVARDAAVVGGAAAIKAGISKSKEAKIHVEALHELAASFDAEMEPLLVDVEGQTLRLTGSAETQFVTWRQLLHQIFVTESGLPVDPNASSAVAPGAPLG